MPTNSPTANSPVSPDETPDSHILSFSRSCLASWQWHTTLALVVALIAAVITASLPAGHSVRQTLTDNTFERLNGGATW
ncbi:MAG: hypothetical protein MZV63_62855 [Marinilabiliales bacterium]|nr:hypothetical protein [Marinilabiliales bacterium]